MNYVEEIKRVYSYIEIYESEFSDYKDDIYFWSNIVKEYKPKVLLEVGIGFGRIIDLLYDKVEEYIGIDISKEVIEYCNKKYNHSNIHLYNKDIRKSSINKKVDMIILPFNVINNFYTKEDFNKLFKNLKKMSHSNTVIIIDTFNPNNEYLKKSKKYKVTHDFKLNGKTINVWEKHEYDSINKTNIYHKKFEENGNILVEYILPNRIIFPDELRNIIKTNGFEIITEYGDYNKEEMKEESRKYIVVFRRREK